MKIDVCKLRSQMHEKTGYPLVLSPDNEFARLDGLECLDVKLEVSPYLVARAKSNYVLGGRRPDQSSRKKRT